MAKSRVSPTADFSLPDRGLLTSTQTARVLGFETTGALSRARQQGRLPFQMFQLPGRRGWFALTSDVRAWVDAVVEAHVANRDRLENQGAHG